MALVAFTDGASSGNPGPSGLGVALYRDGFRVEEFSEYIGIATNNIAEYTAVIRALEAAHQMGERRVHIKTDSQLVVRQLTGEYRVKDPELKQLKRRIDKLCFGLEVQFEHIPREKNGEADALSKAAVKLGGKQAARERQARLSED